MTKEHPIILNTAMVQALLMGRKTQHRLVRRTAKLNLRKCNGINCGDKLWVRTKNCSPLRRDSRITLTVTDVRLERLQDITEEDAIAEGVEGWDTATGGDDYQDYWKDYLATEKDEDEGYPHFMGDPVASYQSLWESLYGKGSWDANPEVVALTFEVEVRE